MESKVRAAQMTTSFGIETYIVPGKERHVVLRVLQGEKLGTHFVAQGKKTHSYQKWLAAGAFSKGRLVIDPGAERALRNKKSLLLNGITQVEGDFDPKDLVSIYNQQGQSIGVGEVKLSDTDLKQHLGNPQSKASGAGAPKMGKVVIHCDHLFLH